MVFFCLVRFYLDLFSIPRSRVIENIIEIFLAEFRSRNIEIFIPII